MFFIAIPDIFFLFDCKTPSHKKWDSLMGGHFTYGAIDDFVCFPASGIV